MYGLGQGCFCTAFRKFTLFNLSDLPDLRVPLSGHDKRTSSCERSLQELVNRATRAIFPLAEVIIHDAYQSLQAIPHQLSIFFPVPPVPGSPPQLPHESASTRYLDRQVSCLPRASSRSTIPHNPAGILHPTLHSRHDPRPTVHPRTASLRKQMLSPAQFPVRSQIHTQIHNHKSFTSPPTTTGILHRPPTTPIWRPK